LHPNNTLSTKVLTEISISPSRQNNRTMSSDNEEQQQHAASPSPEAGAPAPASPSKDQHFSPLSRIPVDIQHKREAMFLLEAPMVFERNEWDRYFQYVAGREHFRIAFWKI
jgi:hypothetical protein